MSPGEDELFVFTGVAPAVADAQELLDSLARGQPTQYSIPRADAELRFLIEIEGDGRVRFFFRKKHETSRSAHSLRYSVIAVQERPEPPPRQPRAIELIVPPYLLRVDDEQQIAAAIEHAAGGRSESPKKSDQGLVCFRLNTSTGYLAVRVKKKPDQDVLYVGDPDGSALQEPTRQYRAFGILFEALRAAGREHAPRSYPYQLGDAVSWGWDQFHQFLTQLWNNYVEAADNLANRKPAGDPQVFYVIDNFQGSFFYSVWKPKSEETAVNPFDSGDDWIHNHVAVRSHSGATAQVELQAPEFVIAGDARTTLLDQIGAAAAKIASEFEDSLDVAVDKRELERAPRDALLLLSYDGEPPKKGFLAVWPGKDGELLFTFDSNGEKITDLKVRDFVAAGMENTAQISKKTYDVMHNFFRAIRLWRTRTMTT